MLNCFKCNKWWSLYYFFCKRCWSTRRNSSSKFYSNIFFKNKNNKKITKHNKKEKKHDKILMFTKSKLNSTETLVSQALTDMEISNEKFNTIRKEKKNTRR